MRDLYHNLAALSALAPAVQAAAATGAAIDLAGFGSVIFVVNTGAISGAGDFGAKVQESDTDQTSDFTDAAASVVLSNAPATLAADSAYRLGYVGHKRYVRIALTKAGGTSIIAGATAIKGNAESRPVT